MSKLPRLARLALAGSAILVVALVAALYSSPRPALASHGCAAAGSTKGPFDLVTYEASDYRTKYGQAMELAGKNQLFPASTAFKLTRPETGPRAAGSSTTAAAYVPPTILKAIAWIESGWAMANQSVPYGGVGPPLVSHSCAYGVMQVLSGMENRNNRPTIDQVFTGSHYGFNIAKGARILVDKWNLAPEYRPIVGDRNPAFVENWYYALWSYHGFSFVNHPANFSPSRGEFKCNGTQPYGSFPYQELILGCVKNPPTFGGQPLWTPISVTLPSNSNPAFSLLAWNNCAASYNCAGMDFATPTPAHTDPTVPSGSISQALGSPNMALTESNIDISVRVGDPSPAIPVRVLNNGTGPLIWRLSPSTTWLKLSTIQGVSLGTDTGWNPGRFVVSVDTTGLAEGTYVGDVFVESRYSQGLPQKVTVTLRITMWDIARAQILSGDVNGDSKGDVIGPQDFGGGVMRIRNFLSNGTGFTADYPAFEGCAGCWTLTNSRMMTADVNGDGKDDAVGAYDYGNGVMKLWTFTSDGTNFSTVRLAHPGCAGCWNMASSQLVPADVNGDGKDDIVGIYNYGNGLIKMWTFVSDGTNFTSRLSFTGCAGCWNLDRSRMVAADVNGDGKDDIVGIYDYGNALTKIWTFTSDGLNFSSTKLANSGCTGCWNLSRSIMVPADVNGDGKGDIVGIYDYGNGMIRMWNFVSDGSRLSNAQLSYVGCAGCWNLSRSRMLPADVNADGKDEIIGFYDYGNGVISLWKFTVYGNVSAQRAY